MREVGRLLPLKRIGRFRRRDHPLPINALHRYRALARIEQRPVVGIRTRHLRRERDMRNVGRDHVHDDVDKLQVETVLRRLPASEDRDERIARIDFRPIFGYGVLFGAIWFLIGVVVFTFAPC